MKVTSIAIPRDIENVLKNISIKMNIPLSVVKNIYESQFGILKETIEKGEHKNVMLNNFGKFYTSQKQIDLINKKKALKDAKSREQSDSIKE